MRDGKEPPKFERQMRMRMDLTFLGLTTTCGNVQLNIVSQEVMMVHGNGAFGDFTEWPFHQISLAFEQLEQDHDHRCSTSRPHHHDDRCPVDGYNRWRGCDNVEEPYGFNPWHVLYSSNSGRIHSPLNPNEEPATVTWRGSGVTIDALSSYSVAWPPADLDGASMMQSDQPISVVWSGASSPVGVHQMGAVDTGMESGLRVHSNTSNTFNLEMRAMEIRSILNISTLTANETVLNQSESLIVSVDNRNHRSNRRRSRRLCIRRSWIDWSSRLHPRGQGAVSPSMSLHPVGST